MESSALTYTTIREFAEQMDREDPLADYRDQFHIPRQANGKEFIYFTGNSLGLQPKTTRSFVEQELDDWARLGVEGHFRARNPWMPYHEFLAESTARLVGAYPQEVVVMNSLTVNLHLLMVSFYRPTHKRFKIVIEADAFPSDKYAVRSQLRFHGYDPETALIQLRSQSGDPVIPTQEIMDLIEREGNEIALIMIGGVNYYSGQAFEIEKITKAGHAKGCKVGFDLAHAVGNIHLKLHEWGPDFACWCSYKYLNSGPGGIAGIFVHDRHFQDSGLPRFEGWWGHNKNNRFNMPDEFEPMAGAEAWQLSNPPILPLAALRASMKIFEKVGMEALREKSEHLTGYLEYLISELNSDHNLRVITPSDPKQRGCQLSLQAKETGRAIFHRLTKRGVIVDWREPDVIRLAPVPLYNRFVEVWEFAQILTEEP